MCVSTCVCGGQTHSESKRGSRKALHDLLTLPGQLLLVQLRGTPQLAGWIRWLTEQFLQVHVRRPFSPTFGFGSPLRKVSADPLRSSTLSPESQSRWTDKMRKTACCLLLALLQIASPSSATDFIWPGNMSVAVGKAAEFRCTALTSIKPGSLKFHYKGNKGNYSLACPSSQLVENLEKHLKGHCITEDGKVFAVWNVKFAEDADNMTSVECVSDNVGGSHFAFLHLFDNSSKFGILVGSTIGGFLGASVLVGAAYFLLKRSETFQKCYRGKQRESEEDDGADTMEMD